MLRCEGTFTLHLHSAQALAAHATSSKQRPSVEALARFRIRTWVGQVSSECKDRDGRFAHVHDQCLVPDWLPPDRPDSARQARSCMSAAYLFISPPHHSQLGGLEGGETG
jgi:hypothetical protein